MSGADSEVHPRFSRRPAVFASLLVLAAVFLLLIPLPQLGRVSDAVGDLLHPPLFAILAVAVRLPLTRLCGTRRGTANLVVWLAVSGLGILAEYLQQFVGREASVGDGLSDVCGAAAGLAWYDSLAAGSAATKRGLRLVGALLVAIACWLPGSVLLDVVRQHRQLPLVASFEDDLELTRWDPHDSKLSRDSSQATDGEWRLRVDLNDASNPGAILQYPMRDWTGYSNLVFDAACEPGKELRLVVKLEDEAHDNQPDDRFQKTIELTGTTTRFVIPLNEAAALRSGRTLDLSRVSLLQFYVRRADGFRTFYTDNIRLE